MQKNEEGNIFITYEGRCDSNNQYIDQSVYMPLFDNLL